MNRGRRLVRWLAVLAVTAMGLLAAAHWVRVPGYTDADYYMATAVRLAEGRGLTEPFIWNFLAGSDQIPHPSHLYWMPLTTFLAAGSMWLLGISFQAARLPFILSAASLPVVTNWLARRLGATDREAWLAAALAALPGFFLPFLVTTDSFGPYALVGTALLVALARLARRGRSADALLAGALIGGAHLTRADGLLWLAPAGLAVLWAGRRRGRLGLLVAAGYLLVMGPWMLRLAAVAGAPLPPGASRALWLRTYDELFSYPPEALTPGHLLAAGVPEIARIRLQALLQNLLSFVAVNGLVFMTPFMIWGGWQRRREPLVRLAAVYGLLLLAVMSFGFPLPGTRGGFFHSSASLMPLLWALAPMGLSEAIERLAPLRNWEPAKAVPAFGMGAVLIAGAVTAYLLWDRLLEPLGTDGAWGSSAAIYRQVDRELAAIDPAPGIIAVNNPPGFWLASGIPSVVIPDGGPEELMAVVDAFGVEWVVLERNHPQGLADLYDQPRSLSGLRYAGSVHPAHGSVVHLFVATEGQP